MGGWTPVWSFGQLRHMKARRWIMLWVVDLTSEYILSALSTIIPPTDRLSASCTVIGVNRVTTILIGWTSRCWRWTMWHLALAEAMPAHWTTIVNRQPLVQLYSQRHYMFSPMYYYLSDAWTGIQWMTTTDHFLTLLRTLVKFNVPFDFFIAKSTFLARVLFLTLFLTLCLHTVSWDLRRDRASNHFRSIETGENASCNARVVFYVVVVIRWCTGSWIIWSVSRLMARMAFF